METYTEPKELVENPNYRDRKRNSLAGLSDDMIDRPIIGLGRDMNRLPHCYTLQCCYGHFLYEGQDDPDSLEPLPRTHTIGKIEYRIAYVAFCIENSGRGRGLLETLGRITEIDPENIQLCCAEWFWERHVNSYALQVEPDRFKRRDTAELGYEEALRIERIRELFFTELRSSISGDLADGRRE